MSNTISGSTGVANASVTLEGRTQAGRVYVNGTADASGNYSFAGLLPGTYTVSAAAPGFGFNSIAVVLGTTDVNNANHASAAISSGPTALNSSAHRPNGR